MRVVLDTNVLLSTLFVKGGTLETVWRVWPDGRFDVLVGEPLLQEIRRVLQGPKLRKYLGPRDAESILEALAGAAVPVTLLLPYPEAPDSDDAFLLTLARDGDADVIVTGDPRADRPGTRG